MKIEDKVKRVDVKEKLNGKLKYIEDIKFEDLHYARTLRSEIAKGEIKNIVYPMEIKDVYVISHKDVLNKNEVAMILKDMPIFAEKEINYIGEPIALIVSKDRAKLTKFMKNIKVEYETKEAVYSVEEAIKKEENIFTNHTFEKGDINNLDYDEIFEKTYETGYQEQLYMEKQGVVGIYDNDKITVYGSLQCPYYVLNALKHALGEDKQVRVVQSPTGGAFGGKEEYPSLIACQVAIAANKLKKPVRLIFERREDISFTTKRHPSRTIIKTYLKNKEIKGIEFETILDAGPYLGLSDVVLQRAIFTLMGCYNIKNLKVNGKTIKTNNVFTGAFRGFGAPQSMYALEHHINQLIRYLKVDPIEFRRKYFVKKGDTTSTNGIYNEEIVLDKLADKLKEMVNYDLIINNKQKNIGYGFSFIPHGGGFTGDGEATHIKAEVKLKKHLNNKIQIKVSNVEMGQGAITALTKIVATVLDIDMRDIIYSTPDTDFVPDSGPTVASRTTMVVGGLLYKAAEKLKNKMNVQEEIEIVENFKQPDYVVWNQDKIEGNAYMAYSWSALMARVEVDPVTFDVSCTDIYGVYDVGIPIDENLFLGQVNGGVVQGLGYALLETMTSKKGKIEQNSLSSYAIPTTVDIPKIHTSWVVNRYVDGPFGAKAVGELTLVGVAPAIASAIENAMDVEVNKIPVTPERILEAIE